MGHQHIKMLYFRVEEPNYGYDSMGQIIDAKSYFELTVRFFSFFQTLKDLPEKLRIFYTTSEEIWQK